MSSAAFRRGTAAFACLVSVVGTACACGSSPADAEDEPTAGDTTTLAGLISMADRACVVVDVGSTATCGTLGLEHGYSSATWLTVLSGDPANVGKVIVYGNDWAAWGTAEDVAPYAGADGKTQQL